MTRTIMRPLAYLNPNRANRDGFSGDNIVIPELNIIYMAIPKVANSSLKRAFLDGIEKELPEKLQEEIDDDEKEFGVLINKKIRNFLGRNNYLVHRDEVLKNYPDFLKVAFVRDPYDRLVSCWRDKILDEDLSNKRFQNGIHRGFLKHGRKFWRGMTFNQFVESVATIPDEIANPHFKSQTDFLIDNSGRWLPNWVGRFESITKDYESLRQSYAEPIPGLPHGNASQNRKPPPEVDPWTLELIKNRYIKDILMLQYPRSI